MINLRLAATLAHHIRNHKLRRVGDDWTVSHLLSSSEINDLASDLSILFRTLATAVPPTPLEDETYVGPFTEISQDGMHTPNGIRRWLARQLMDSRLTAEEAYGIVAHHPLITDHHASAHPSSPTPTTPGGRT